jgi:endoplasmic reticulum chaperone BiP
MVNEAEEFAEQDRVAKERIDARNGLESYLYSMRNTIDDPEKLANKISEDDKDKIREAIKDGQSWLDANLNAEKEDFEEKMREVQK